MIWVIAALPNMQVINLHSAPRMRVAKGLMEHLEARKRIDTRVPKTVGSSSYTPFTLSEVFGDTAPNQYTLWGSSHRSLYRHGDTLCVAYRRTDTRGSGYIAVAFSFDNGATWTVREDINEAAGLLDAGGRYPNCVGFYNGDPVVTWPELTAGPAWGAACVAVASTSPYGFCTDPSYQTYHTFAWPIDANTYAVIGFTSNDDIIYYTYDLSTATASSVQIIRNSGTGEGVYMYDIGRYQADAYVYGYSYADSGDVIFRIQGDGTVTPAAYPVYYGFVTPSDTIMYIFDANLSIDLDGNPWVVYMAKDTLNNAGSGIGHVMLFNQAEDTSGATARALYIPDPSDPYRAFRKNPMYRPTLAFGPDNNTILATVLVFSDSANYGCPTVTGSSAPPTELVAFASTDGGANWFPADGDLIGDDATADVMEDLYLLNFYPTNGYYVYPGGDVCVVYLTPLDGTTQLYCNAAEENGVAQALIHVSCGQAVGVAEKPAKSGAITTVSVLKGGVEVSGPASIYDAKGALVATTKGGFVSLDRGVYFVKTGNRVSKVVVR